MIVSEQLHKIADEPAPNVSVENANGIIEGLYD